MRLKVIILLFLSCACTIRAYTQQRTIITIVNQKQVSVIDAEILVYSSGKKDITNTKGEVRVELTTSDSVSIYAKNYLPKVFATGAKTGQITITITALNPWEGTVELPWMSQNKLYSSSATSSVSGDILAKNPEGNSGNLLGGYLPGLIVRQGSSQPGGDGATFNIRGFSSYNSLSPLVYVDGVERDIQQIDPLELEQVTILKDNAANGTFGIRGSGRAIMATTKRGIANLNEVTITAQTGLQITGKTPDYLGAQQYMQLYNEAAINDGLPAKYTPAQISAYNDPNRDQLLYPDVNWRNEILKNSTYESRYNVAFRGGSNAFRYFVIVGALNQDGIFKNGNINKNVFGFSNNIDFHRYNFRTNLDFQATKTTVVSLDLSGRLEQRNYPGTATSTIFSAISTSPVNQYPVTYPDGKIGGNTQYQNNPYGLVTNTGYTNEFRRTFLGTVKVNQQLDMITPGLSANGAFAFDSYFLASGGRAKTFAVYSKQADGTYATYGTESLLSVRGRANAQDRTTTFYTNLAYNRDFGKSHIDGFINYNQSVENGSGFDFPYVTQGYASRLTYVFDKRYVAEFNGSYSGSENLPPGKRLGFFPSLSAAWIVSNEPFMKNQAFIDFLKIRGSFGYTGNAEITGTGTQRFLFQDYYLTGASYVFGSNPASAGGRAQARLANPDITWETLRQTNFGFDMYFMKSSFNLSLDVFQERRKNILTNPVVSSTIGIALASDNQGILDNKGIDGQLTYTYNKNKIGFSLGVQGSYTINKLIFNNEVYRPYDYLKRTGVPTSPIFGLQNQGFYTAQEVATINSELSLPPAQKTIPQPLFGAVKPGDMKFKDQNGDHVIDVYDQVDLGSNLPKYFYGFNGSFRYGKFDLNFLFQGAAGGMVDLRNASTQGFQSGGNPSTYVLNRWTPETASTANFPRLSVVSNAINYQTSDFWLAKGDYLKLKSLELGYSISIRNNGKVIAKKVRFFVNGSNLFILDKLPVKWMDPEMLAAGITDYPRLSTINAGAQFTF
ncbi:MAG: SusC/RagA family TonB-linked outer membrane protein [Bacteroidota bacterium]